ncbi:uncharacterized protein METZ01_LOCUS477999, partial [marine metagenome]
MKAIILAAGRGNRMEHLGDKLPKCLIEYKGKAIIERILKILINCGITDITIVVGYQSELIVNHINQSFPDMVIKFIYNSE